MSRPKRSAVHKYHDRVAHQYDASYEDAYWQWHDTLTWEYLKPFLPRDANATVLDLGCGTGKWAAKLLKSGYRVVCVDISARMLDQSRAKVDEQGGARRASFVQADLCDLSMLPEGGAAMAVALGDPIGCTSSPPTAMKQIRKALAPGGVLTATFDNKLTTIDFHLKRGDAEELAEFLRSGRTHWLTKDAAEQFEITTYSPEELRELMNRSGFEVLDLVGKTVLPMRSHRELLVDGEARRRWAQIEKTLCRKEAALGRASHLQIAGRASGK
ncbi:MAG: methyltransferase domain-containing protein [Planctomycetota bacterium]